MSKNDNNIEGASEIRHSRLNIVSYSMSDFIYEIFAISFGAYVFYYYEAEIGLESWLAALGFIVYAIWNAINDPLVGYICDRPFFFTRKWGRRFPWIIGSMFPTILIYVLLFSPPNVDPATGGWIIFGWLVLATCLFDTALSFWIVNYAALFADKFRNLDERRTAGGILMILAYIGIAVGSLIPPFIVQYGVKESFLNQAWALVIIALIGGVFAIPGLREDKEVVEKYIKSYESRKETGDKATTFMTFKHALKHKNFIVYILLFLGYSILRACLVGSLQYGLRFVLKLPAVYSTILMGAYLISSLISTPILAVIGKKKADNRKIMLIGALISCVFALPMALFADLISWTILLICWGVGIAAMFVVKSPLLADIIDESVIQTGERNEGLYNGVSMFIMRFSTVAQAIIFAVVHTLTGFEEGADVQSELAITGILIGMALIPSLFLLAGTLIFWKFYDLSPGKIQENRLRLKEYDL